MAVVDLWAEWCKPCLRLAPKYAEFADELGGAAGQMTFLKVDVQKAPDVMAFYKVLQLPAIIFLQRDANVRACVPFFRACVRACLPTYLLARALDTSLPDCGELSCSGSI